jgi:hypothetical protein
MRLGEVDERMRDLRTLKQELKSLRGRIADDGVAPVRGHFCHFIESSTPG